MRQFGYLIVQIPKKRTSLSAPGWYRHENPLLSFVDAIYVCRRALDDDSAEIFSDILGGPEQRLSTHLHATLIAGLAIISVTGGLLNIEHLAQAILDAGPQPGQPIPHPTSNSWQVLNRIKCPCASRVTHDPHTPVAAAKATGISIWKERAEETITRV